MNTLKAILSGFLVLVAGLTVLVAIVVICIAITGSMHRNMNVSLGNGGSLHIAGPTLWARLASSDAKSVCKIAYRPKNGKPGEVVFWNDYMDEPIIVFPAPDGHSLFCLYGTDTVTLLFKIDPDRSYDDPPFTDTLKVISSPWHVEEASLNGWEEAQKYLTNLPPQEFEHLLIPHYGLFHARKSILDRLQMMVDDVEHGGPPYPGGVEPWRRIGPMPKDG